MSAGASVVACELIGFAFDLPDTQCYIVLAVQCTWKLPFAITRMSCDHAVSTSS